MAWRRIGDRPLSEPMLTRSLTHICGTKGRWIKWGKQSKCVQIVVWIAIYGLIMLRKCWNDTMPWLIHIACWYVPHCSETRQMNNENSSLVSAYYSTPYILLFISHNCNWIRVSNPDVRPNTNTGRMWTILLNDCITAMRPPIILSTNRCVHLNTLRYPFDLYVLNCFEAMWNMLVVSKISQQWNGEEMFWCKHVSYTVIQWGLKPKAYIFTFH